MKVETRCKIIDKRRLSADAVFLTLQVGDMVRKNFCAPGQFVHIKCGESRFLRRPISVCLCMEDQPEDTLAIVFEVRGEGTAWLADRETGDMLDVLGLLGNGFSMETAGRYLLVGGGIGVPPLLGCASRSSQAILGFRSREKAILIDRFQEACAGVQVATDDGSLGYHGFVDALVRRTLETDQNFTAVLACGPKPMLKSVARAAAEFGVPCQVSMEERMACGVGACLGCATPMADGTMKHVCKDGPVFPASEVDWNA